MAATNEPSRRKGYESSGIDPTDPKMDGAVKDIWRTLPISDSALYSQAGRHFAS